MPFLSTNNPAQVRLARVIDALAWVAALGYTIYVAQTQDRWDEMMLHYLLIAIALSMVCDGMVLIHYTGITPRWQGIAFIICAVGGIVFGLVSCLLWRRPGDEILVVALMVLFAAMLSIPFLIGSLAEKKWGKGSTQNL